MPWLVLEKGFLTAIAALAGLDGDYFPVYVNSVDRNISADLPRHNFTTDCIQHIDAKARKGLRNMGCIF